MRCMCVCAAHSEQYALVMRFTVGGRKNNLGNQLLKVLRCPPAKSSGEVRSHNVCVCV